MPIDPDADIEITAFDWVPDFARGFVRDLRPRWACEELGLPYRERLISAVDRPDWYYAEQPFGQVPVVKRPPRELDLLTGQRLLSTVARMSAFPPVPNVHLVLDHVTFADVSGVRAVVACRDMVQARGADLVMVDPSPAVRRILDLAPGLDQRCEAS